MIKDLVSFSLQNARNRKLRSWLTILGIVIGIAAIVGLITVSNGLEEAISSQFGKIGTNKLLVFPKQEVGNFNAAQELSADDVSTLEKMSEFKWITPYLIESANVEYAKETHFRPITANPIDNIDGRWADIDFGVKEGRLWQTGEKFAAVIGTKTAEDLFDKEIKIGNQIMINGRKFKVIGIFEEMGDPESDNMIHIPLETAREIFNKKNELSYIEIVGKQGIDLEKVAEKAIRNLKKARNNENFEVKTPAQLLEQLGSLLKITQIIFISIASISLVVGGIGIMNSMFTSVLERRRDIGIMKAIGASNKHIMILFLAEAAMFGLVGGFIGIMLGSFGAYTVKIIAGYFGFELIKIAISPWLVTFSLAFSIGVGMLSGFIPAYQAAKLKPVEALQYG